METRRIKDYQEFIKSIRINEALSVGSGEFSPFTVIMLNWCGFEKNGYVDAKSPFAETGTYDLVFDVKNAKNSNGEYCLYTSVSPQDGECVFQVIVQGDYLKGLITGSQEKKFRGPKAKILGDILSKLRESSGGAYHESPLSGDNKDGFYIKTHFGFYKFIYKISMEELIEIIPIWSDFMSYIGYAPKSEMKANKSEEGSYFGPGILENFREQYRINNLKLKRLEFIFPGNWDEYATLQWAKEFGLLAPVFTSIKEGIEYMKSLEGIKFDEVLVGSHGANSKAYTRMLGAIEDPKDADAEVQEVTGFLKQLAKMVREDSIVYFTSCYAGNNKERLVEVAKIVGCTIYGSEGVNYLGYNSEKGKFWRAKTDGTFEETGDKPPFVMDFEAGSFLNGVSMIGQSMTYVQMNKIKAFGKSVSAEWKKFEKNPWGYVADPCTEYIEKKVESLKKNAEDLYNQTGKVISDTYNQAGNAIKYIWNSW
jgi:hypothetical protein